MPGLVEGLYLGGSLGFGEWYEGRSDIDFVALTAGRPDAADVSRLHELHDEVGDAFPRPYLSGELRDLGRPGPLPRRDARRPRDPRGCVARWRARAEPGGVARAGPPRRPAARTRARRRPHPRRHGRCRAYSHRNLSEYWEPNLTRLAEHREPRADRTSSSGSCSASPACTMRSPQGRSPRRTAPGTTRWRCSVTTWRTVVAEALTHRARASLGEVAGSRGRARRRGADVLSARPRLRPCARPDR